MPAEDMFVEKGPWPFLDANAPLPFEALLAPFVSLARRRLLTQVGNAAELLTETAHLTLQRHLLQMLVSLSLPTLQAELARSHTQAGRSNEQRDDIQHYRHFLQQMRRRGLAMLLQTHSVLARLLATSCDLWVEANVEFIHRLQADRSDLVALSDMHAGRHSVMALTFASGSRLVYKPRSIGMEEAYAHLLQWCNAQGATPPFKSLALLNRDSYGWVEFVTCEPCQDQQGLRRYYQRAGMLLCVVYLLGGTYCFYDQIIKGSLFADRLAMDGIPEQDLLALLAEPLEALQERFGYPTAPDWVTELVDALHTDPAPPPALEMDLEHLSQQFPLLQPFYPLLQRSIARLQTGLEVLTQTYATLPYDPRTILALLLPNLLQAIGPQVSKTLVLELHVARLRGHLHGETPQQRFQDYLRQLCQGEHLLSFLQEYCVLARHIVLSSQLWADCSLEFVQRLCADWQEILAVFSPEREPGVLTRVAGGAGDTHRGGHSVIVMTFRSGWRLLYKPKPLTIELHFQELLVWLNARGSHPTFRLLKLIDKTTYGWTEHIAASSCSSEEEVARFYVRQGGYLALLYGLEATDFKLRLADSERVPSLLTLAPPRADICL